MYFSYTCSYKLLTNCMRKLCGIVVAVLLFANTLYAQCQTSWAEFDDGTQYYYTIEEFYDAQYYVDGPFSLHVGVGFCIDSYTIRSQIVAILSSSDTTFNGYQQLKADLTPQYLMITLNSGEEVLLKAKEIVPITTDDFPEITKGHHTIKCVFDIDMECWAKLYEQKTVRRILSMNIDGSTNGWNDITPTDRAALNTMTKCITDMFRAKYDGS